MNTTLVKQDRRRKVAAGTSQAMRRIAPFIFAGLLSVLLFMTLCFADSGTSGSIDDIEGASGFFDQAFTVLEILIVLIGGGLALWGIVNLLEGYGNDNPGAKSQGIKQLMSGAGIILVGVLLVPFLKTIFTSNT